MTNGRIKNIAEVTSSQLNNWVIKFQKFRTIKLFLIAVECPVAGKGDLY